ncbi:MAG: hypothetical protein A2341_05850 [Deltaproteobacteria bacterium RIFOXYB12_FULL_58_9]|nr:MAG: hypothetical protein A2341_05850 [Deltaproteobacteria bacterium RIFOXYB12_FULL_58_9]
MPHRCNNTLRNERITSVLYGIVLATVWGCSTQPVGVHKAELPVAPDLTAIDEVDAPMLQVTRAPGEVTDSGEAVEREHLPITEVNTKVRIVGPVAKTRVTMTFYNPHDRVLEGDLVFPLPADATVTGYALDIEGQLVDAVAVGKEKARVVFEKEVRKGVDPGIVEWVGGNHFRTRVYPIPPKGSRTIAVETVRELALHLDGSTYTWPVAFPSGLEKYDLRVEIPDLASNPRIELAGQIPLSVSGGDGVWIGEAKPAGKPLTGRLTIAVPGKPRTVAVESHNHNAEGTSGSAYFLINQPLTTRPSANGVAAKKVVIFWDASRSQEKTDHARILSGFAAFFAALDAASIAVELWPFSDAMREPATLTIRGGDIEPLRKAVTDIIYDGGTQLGVIKPQGKAASLYFLVSDGVSTFGHSEPAAFSAPVFTVSAATKVNTAFMGWLGTRSGGAYFNLADSDPSVMSAAAGSAPLVVKAINVQGGQVADVLPGIGQPLTDKLSLSGRLESQSATVEVELGVAGETVDTIRFELTRGQTHGDLLALLWAQKKVAQLAAFPKQNEKALTDVGKRFGLVTPYTSLIVLERLEQYIEHDIRPPATLLAWRRAFDEQVAGRVAQEKVEHQRKLERIVGLWNERIAWWETKFKYPRDLRVAGESKKSRREESAGDDFSSAPPPAPSMERMDSAEAAKEDAPSMKDEAPSAKTVSDSNAVNDSEPSIELKPWTPDTPYLKNLDAANDAYAAYLAERKSYGASPAFYLDCADFFFRKEQRSLGLRVLSNVAELELEDAALLRVLAHRLAQLEFLDLAAIAFEQVLSWRPEEPQSYRDLALVLGRSGNHLRALELLAHVVMNQWDRFDEIELIALMEFNALVPQARKAGITELPLDERLIKLLDLDLRISLSWDTDLTDIDMWVIEPSGEKAYYGNNRSQIGGLVSRDFTQGYGPEEYVIHRAMRGEYTVQANFFGSSAQTLTGAVTLQLELFTHYGRPNEKRKAITLRLNQARDTITVGTIKF